MTDLSKKHSLSKIEKTIPSADEKICGIVMPISSMCDDYTAIHWSRVRRILEAAIVKAGFTPKVVWDSPEISIIQAKILKNIYENDVVICDLSNLNPNVMLEAGLRLSTKKPTIIVTDEIKKPPFDVSSIEYIPYERNLEYNSINSFIDQLSRRINLEYNSYKSGEYKSFVDNYKFEIATPSTIQVPGEEYILKQIKEVKDLLLEVKTKSNVKHDEKDIKKELNNFSCSFKYEGTREQAWELINDYLDNFRYDQLSLGGSQRDNYFYGRLNIIGNVHDIDKASFYNFLKENGFHLRF